MFAGRLTYIALSKKQQVEAVREHYHKKATTYLWKAYQKENASNKSTGERLGTGLYFLYKECQDLYVAQKLFDELLRKESCLDWGVFHQMFSYMFAHDPWREDDFWNDFVKGLIYEFDKYALDNASFCYKPLKYRL